MATDPLEKALLIAEGMERKRGLDVMVLDMRELMTICDYFVICHGRSAPAVAAIRDGVEEYLEQRGLRPDHREGRAGGRWTILDYGTVVAHIFTEEAREFYDLERLWDDAAVVEHVAEARAAQSGGSAARASVEHGGEGSDA